MTGLQCNNIENSLIGRDSSSPYLPTPPLNVMYKGSMNLIKLEPVTNLGYQKQRKRRRKHRDLCSLL
ncbi:hypothetical protein EMCRGX_G031456 [Ephydatia muelleri]